MSEELELVVADEQKTSLGLHTGSSPMEQMMAAAQSGISPEYLGQMMELQQKWEAANAKKAYVAAMAAFKNEPLKIVKDKAVNFGGGKASYSHATLASVVDAVASALSKHGLSHQWRTNQTDKGITVECVITHDMGHSESVSLTAPADTTGSKNSIQAIGSTVTYLQRYTLMAITGLAAADMDDDGHVSSKEAEKWAAWQRKIDGIATIEDLEAARASTIEQFKGAQSVPRQIVNMFAARMGELS